MSHRSHNNGEKLPNKFGTKTKRTLQSISLATALVCGNPSAIAPIAIGTAAIATTLTSCDPDDGPLGPKEIDKNEAPKLKRLEETAEAKKGATLSFDGLNLKLGNTVIAEFSDDYSKILSVSSFTINGKSVTLPYTLNEAGYFTWELIVKDFENGTAPAKTTSVSGNITIINENGLKGAYDIPEIIDVRNYTERNDYKNNVDIYKGPDINQAKKWYEIYEKNGHVLTLAILKTLNALGGSERQEALKNRELVMVGEKPELGNPETDGLREYESDERIGSTHGTTRVEIIKNNSKRIPGIAQDFPNKIICLEGPNSRKNFYNLASSNPNKKYIGYDASNDLLSKNFNDFKVDTEGTDGYYLKKLLNLSNALLINCILNNEDEDHNSLNQNQPPQDNGRYGTFSFNGNQIVTVGYNNTGVFHSYDKYKPEFKDYYTSGIPIGYKYVIASPRYPYDVFGEIFINEYNTTSSFQNAVTTGTVVNYSMQKPSMTISELMERNENSLEDVKEVYHNDNEPLTGTNIKYQNSYEFNRDLHYPTFPEHISSTEITDLSGYFETDMPIWITYPGIEAYIDGQWQPTFTYKNFTDSQKLEVSISKKYRFNPELLEEQNYNPDDRNPIQGKMYMLNENGKGIDEDPNSPMLYLD